ncbi:maleate cis-trans isomerase family protein [Streptomyces sp. BA2]|uniref:maleate cis-trans isomerase family protein n=1 Tax=Streptomyces sp. BA2 TaxID=436595 RepID=UPI00132164D7|nr:arylmalonate decarboxylase [Streptomyces sp. BA2]MWA08079.1 arylmalonate decarboxylase [Streptomyces sp. BA2]
MDIPSVPRLGLVVPPENPTAEPEFRHFLGSGMNVYTSRFPVLPGTSLREMLETYNEVLPDVLAGFGQLRLDAAVVACSASHYLLSPEGDRTFCAELSDRAGFPVVSSTLAILAACEALGLNRLTLVSPYEPWLTDLSRSYWEEAGLTVDQVVPVPAGERYDPYQVTTGTILERMGRYSLPENAAVLFTGTGMFTLDAMDELGARPGRVLLSSNLASAWWAQLAAGAQSEGLAGHPLVERPARAA